jgi:hypothetical protein
MTGSQPPWHIRAVPLSHGSTDRWIRPAAEGYFRGAIVRTGEVSGGAMDATQGRRRRKRVLWGRPFISRSTALAPV